MVVGGSDTGDGGAATSFFKNGEFTQGPKLNIARSYNSAVTLSNGQVRDLVFLLVLICMAFTVQESDACTQPNSWQQNCV